ncbi:MAG: hypothetical protein NT062_27885 [Proteobacteria bacterium]|nr:hypothetical protein [Pseudomonadota bacterium]
MADVTFRDFAGALIGGNDQGADAAAARVLEQLLALDPTAAAAATTHFRTQMAANPAFMGKAMGLRTAVTSGSEADIGALLVDCFALAPSAVPGAIAALRVT